MTKDNMVERVACPDCEHAWAAPPALPHNADPSKVLDAFYSAIPERFGTCPERYGIGSHGTVAAAIPLCENDLMWLRGIRAAIATMRGSDSGVTEEMIEAGIAAAQEIECAMRVREVAENPEDFPDYDEGDVAKAIYLAMSSASAPDSGALREALVEARHVLGRYRQETPLGHQPHMIAHKADATLAKIDAALNLSSETGERAE